jgi:hypothetical protein
MVWWAKQPRGSGSSRELTLDDWRDMCGEAMAAALKFQARVLELERELSDVSAERDAALRIGSSLERTVFALGRIHGFGRLMQLTAEEWRRTGKHPGSEFAIGPCVSATEPCLDCTRSGCDWCAGCGWVTHKVRRVQGLVRDRTIEGAADVLAGGRSGLRVAK